MGPFALRGVRYQRAGGSGLRTPWRWMKDVRSSGNERHPGKRQCSWSIKSAKSLCQEHERVRQSRGRGGVWSEEEVVGKS